MPKDYQDTTPVDRKPVAIFAPDLSNKTITQIIIDEWRASETIEKMKIAQAYFLIQNAEIMKKSRSYRDASGKIVENPNASNVQIPSTFLRSNVLQKVNYAFGKPFIINVENVNTSPEEQEQDELAKKYLQLWQKFIDTYVRKTIKRVATNAINKGIGWAYLWIDDEGNLKMVDIDPDTIYPQWADRPHTKLDVLVRDYPLMQYIDSEGEIIQKVEYWDDTTVERYIDKDGELTPDTDIVRGKEGFENVSAHMQMGEEGVGWGRIPFLSLKGNEDEMPLLFMIKAYIDAYDMLTSISIDSLVDDIDPVLILKNISSEIGGLLATRELLKSSRIAAIDVDGGAEYLQVKSDITAVLSELENLRRNITKFSHDVDFEDVRFGGNPNQLVIKSMFQSLDTFIEGIETEFEVFMDGLKYFFDRWLEFKGEGTAEQWGNYKLIVTLDRDMMINNSALIADTVALVNTGVSQETIDIYNPAVESHEIEQARREAEEAIMLEKQKQQSEMFAFQQAQMQSSIQKEFPELAEQPLVTEKDKEKSKKPVDTF